VTKKITTSAGGARRVNNTCNILHVPRTSQFSANDVLKQVDILATGATTPADLNDTFKKKGGVSWLGEESSDVLSCTWSKDIDGVNGTLSFQLKPRPGGVDYLETVFPGDLLFVYMDDAGTYDPNSWFSGTLATIAIIDRVSESTTVQNMATVKVISVAARDLAVILSESSTVMDQAFAVLENAMFTGEYIGRLFGDKKQNALSPMENILILLLLLYDKSESGSKLNELQWKMSPGGTETIDGSDGSDGTLSQLTQLVSLIDVTTYVQNPMPFYSLAEPPGIIQAGNVWSLLESYANTLINEFFVDIRDVNQQERDFSDYQSNNSLDTYFSTNPDDVNNQDQAVQKALESNLFRANVTQTGGAAGSNALLEDGASVAALVLRQRPYDDTAFFKLPYTEVDSTEIDSLEIARSSHDVFNWFRIRFPNIDVKMQEVISGLRIVPQSIANFGFRRMDAETRYMFTSSAGSLTFNSGNTKTDFSDVFNHYTDLLTSWFAQNEYWYAGQMSMRFKPSIRCGTRLRLNKENGQQFDFYVQGVQHSFVKDPGGSRSTFTLTRGRQWPAPAVVATDFQHDSFTVSTPEPEVAAPAAPGFANFKQGVIPGLGG